MLLRSITKHVQEQNWYAIGIDFFIVVVGVFIGLQVQQWALEIERQSSERQYLNRLHSEIESLAESRALYNRTRSERVVLLKEAAVILANSADDLMLSELQCDAIASSSYTTIPPADLPTVRELLSSGRLDRILSARVSEPILDYTQGVARARDLIIAISDNSEDLARIYPSLIRARVKLDSKREWADGIWFDPICDTRAMQKDNAFMNAFSLNAYSYIVYATRAILPVSDQLNALHETLDQALSIDHIELKETL